MSELKNARMLLEKAREDLTALTGMLDAGIFTDEIFGFHAQQAIEKSLKSWIDLLGHEYPLVHDLRELFRRLSDYGADTEQFMDLLKLNIYAVLFRYITKDSHIEPVDRPATIKRVRALVEHVADLLEQGNGS